MASGPQILVAVTADGKQAVAEFKNVGDAAKFLADQAEQTKGAFQRMHEGLTKASEKLGEFGTKAFDAGKRMTVGLTLPILEFGKKSVEAYAEAEKAQTQLADAFTRFKNLSDTNIDTVNKLADATLRKTRFDDDAVRASYATIAQYGITGKQINALLPLMTDYAAKTGKDLPAAAEVLGKALLGKGKALAEVGIKFKDTKTLAGNYAEVMDGLSAKVKGYAEKDAQTASGKTEQLKNNFQNLQESIGQQLLPILTKLGDKLLGVLDAFNKLDPGTQKIIIGVALLAAAAGPLAMVFGGLATAASFLVGTTGLVVLAVAALAAGFIYAYTHSETFRAKVDAVVQWLKVEVPKAFDWVKEKVQEAIDAISRFWDRWGADITRIASATFDYLKNLVQASFDTIKGIWEVFSGLFTGDWHKVWTGLKDVVKGTFEGITAGIRAFGGLLLDAAKWAFEKVLDGFTAGFSAAWTWLKALPGKIVHELAALPGQMVDLGESAMSGLWQGIKSGARKFLLDGNLKAKVKEIKQAAADAQRSKSPSLDYMELGEWAMEGYALGITKGRDRATTAVVGAINDAYSRAGEAARNGSSPLADAVFGSMAGEAARTGASKAATAIFGSMAGEAARNGGKQLADALFTSMAGEAARNGRKVAEPLFAAMAGEAARNGTTVYTPLIAAMAGEAARNGSAAAKPLFAAMAGEAARNGAQQIATSLRTVLMDEAKSLGYDMGAVISEELAGSVEDIAAKMFGNINTAYGTKFGASVGAPGSGDSGNASVPRTIADLYAAFGGQYGDAARQLLGQFADWNNTMNAGGPTVHPFAPNPVTGGTLLDRNGNPVLADDFNAVKDALANLGVPAMASGGIVSAPTLALIGEAGPEAVVPLSGAGSTSAGNVTVNVAGSVIAERDLVDQIRKSLIVAQQRGLTLVP